MTDCRCGGDGWIVAEHGDVAVSELCPVCGPFFDAVNDADVAFRIGCAAPSDYTMNLLFDRSKALFADAMARCDRALHEVEA